MIADGIASRVLTPVESACELMEAAVICGLVIVDETRSAPGMLVDVARARGLKVAMKLRSRPLDEQPGGEALGATVAGSATDVLSLA